jgi:hypothetical protein
MVDGGYRVEKRIAARNLFGARKRAHPLAEDMSHRRINGKSPSFREACQWRDQPSASPDDWQAVFLPEVTDKVSVGERPGGRAVDEQDRLAADQLAEL